MIEFLFIVGLTLFIGFLANITSERTKISSVLILMAFGFIIGPVMGFVDATPGSMISEISEFISILALAILLFDGGMMLDLLSVVKAIPKSTLFTVICFTVTVVLSTAFSVFFLHWPILHALLMGAVVGGTSSAIVIKLIEKSGIGADTLAMLTIESTTTDALCIITAMIVMQIILTSELAAGDIGNMLVSSFLIAIFVGILSAIVWIAISHRIESIENYGYMLTLAMVFITYSLAELIKGSGGFAVFVFGLVLGNAPQFSEIFNIKPGGLVIPTLRIFQKEVTFFVRTFFFVYIGLLLAPSNFSTLVIGAALAITLISLFARKISQKIVLPNIGQPDKDVVISMMPRGLAAAVLAVAPVSMGIVVQDFTSIVLGVLAFTNIGATFGVFLYGGEHPLVPRMERKLKRRIVKAEKRFIEDFEESEKKRKLSRVKRKAKKKK